MAKKRASQAEDPLKTPIVRPSGLVVAIVAYGYREDPMAQEAVWNAAEEWLNREKAKKILMLLERFRIPLKEPDCWLALSMRLAEEHYPGLRVVDYPPRTRGRPKGTGKIDRYELYMDVEIILRTQKDADIAKACRFLAKDRKSRWRGHPAESLEARYYEQLREFETRVPNSPMISFLRRAAARICKNS